MKGTPAKQTARLPEPPLPDTATEASDLTLDEFLESLPAQKRVEHVEPKDYYDD
jgi:hypothetical protein